MSEIFPGIVESAYPFRSFPCNPERSVKVMIEAASCHVSLSPYEYALLLNVLIGYEALTRLLSPRRRVN